jgi:hypothetical protein
VDQSVAILSPSKISKGAALVLSIGCRIRFIPEPLSPLKTIALPFGAQIGRNPSVA